MDETLAHQVQYSVLWLKPSIFNKKSEEFFPIICSQTWEFVTFSSEIISKNVGDNLKNVGENLENVGENGAKL